MTQAKTTKRALLLSCLSMLLCMSMLVGTTFAWFTDSASTGTNTIVSGNLDIALYKGNVNDDYSAIAYETAEVTNETLLFNEDALYEPGYTEVAYLKIENLGNLAAKYKLTVAFSNEVAGTNVNGETYYLSNVLRYSVLEIGADEYYADRAAALEAIAATEGELASQAMEGYLTAKGDTKYYAIVIYMPESTDNDANPKTGTIPPSIDIGVSLVATQYNYEEDSFDKDYDADAAYPVIPEAPEVEKETYTVVTAQQLHDALAQAYSNETDTVTIEINGDFVLAEGETWEGFSSTVGGTNIIVNGNGHTISGLNNPLLGATWGADGTITINDLTLINSTVVASATPSGLGAGAFAYSSNTSGGIVFNNCHLKDSSVTCTDSYAGGLIGYTNGPNNAFKNCSVIGCTISGESSTGAIAGQIGTVATDVNTITDVVVQNCKITGGRVDKTGLIAGSMNDGQVTITVDATKFTGNQIAYGDTALADNNTTVFGRFVINSTDVSKFVLNGKVYTNSQDVISFE